MRRDAMGQKIDPASVKAFIEAFAKHQSLAIGYSAVRPSILSDASSWMNAAIPRWSTDHERSSATLSCFTAEAPCTALSSKADSSFLTV